MSIKVINKPGEPESEPISITQLDMTCLVGHKVTLFSDQFPGRPLASRVTATAGHTVSLDRSGGSGLVNNLVNNQKLTVKLSYKGEEIAIRGTLKKVDGGRCQVIFDDKVQPLFRRRFPRVFHRCAVKLASVRIQTFSRDKLALLRWMETDAINISGGGVLLGLSAYLEKPTYLLLNVDCAEAPFPPLVLGQVCHCKQSEIGQFHIGIEFVPREDQKRQFSPFVISQLPPILSDYDDVRRVLLSKRLLAWMQNEND